LPRSPRPIQALPSRLSEIARNLDNPDEILEVFGDFDPTRFADEVEQRWGDTDAHAERLHLPRHPARKALSALVAYADAVSARHRATKNLYFDVTQLALILRGRREVLERMATLIRQIGVGRILYGSDGPIFGNEQPAEAWATFRRELPLTGDEFKTIANNIAPYIH
jgi:hypothetical protein